MEQQAIVLSPSNESRPELVTVERTWEITLDLPGWTRRRDQIREQARPR